MSTIDQIQITKEEFLKKAVEGFDLKYFDLSAICFDEEIEIIPFQIALGECWIDYKAQIWVVDGGGIWVTTDVVIIELHIWNQDGEEVYPFTKEELKQAIINNNYNQ